MKRIITIKISLLATLLCMQSVWAEDIEIYQNSSSGVAGVRPNVLFILDTSGSMNDYISSKTTYDPGHDYSLDAGACFDKTRLYVDPNGKATIDETKVNCTAASKYISTYYLKSQNQCARSTKDANGNAAGFDVAGFFSTTWSQWITSGTNKGWRRLSNNSTVNNYIECIEDNSVHGNGGAETYIKTSPGSNTTIPYTSVAADSSWAALGSTRANVGLTIYSANYMNWIVTGGVTSDTKLNIMRDVIINTLFGVEGVNIGLMKYNYRSMSCPAEDTWSAGACNDGGVMKYPIIDAAATRQDLTNMKNWNAQGSTPISENLYEAYLVFAGKPPVFSNRLHGESNEGTTTVTKNGVTRFVSPVDKGAAACQTQYIVFLSDGMPTRDATNATDKSLIETAIGAACVGSGVNSNGTAMSSTATNGKCADDIAGWMNKVGFSATLEDGTVIDNVKVTTYTIGFGGAGGLAEFFKPVAEAGGGRFIEAQNREQLVTAILDIVNEIKNINTTFTSPAISVNAFNRTTHRSELYYTIFKPSMNPHWDGNMKRYKLQVDSTTGAVEIVDANGKPAIDPVTGFFSKDATSWWTDAIDAPDGDLARQGGAASKLTNKMNVYTNVAGNDLSTTSNELTSANVTYAQLGIAADSVYRDRLISWARGMDVNLENDTDGDSDPTDPRRLMGDPLHASPALVQYGGTEADPDITAYVATNDGFLHAFNTKDGTEIFSFVPQELLKNLDKAYVNDTGTGKLYGLDNSVTAWVNDANKDGVISGSDHVYLYFGMGRGGRNVYAMDVTSRSAPKMMWTIHGGVDADFTELGLTFSSPVHRKIRVGGAEKHVVIFGGGFDTQQDSVFVRTMDNVGRAIYMVEAETGKLLWRGDRNVTGLTDMNYGIPSDIAVADVSGDGLIDRMYVGDMGGQIWRIYIDNDVGRLSSDFSKIISPSLMANLADSDAAGNRRFYYAPDVALMDGGAEADYLAVLITSGNRSHPLNKQVQDRVFMLKDRPAKTKPTSNGVITENNVTHDLYDVSINIWGELSTATDAQKKTATEALRKSYGWFFNLAMAYGEKGLSKPLIMQGHAYFTTYTPPDATAASANSCGVNEGTGWLYDIMVSNAVEGQKYDNQRDVTGEKNARLIALPKTGIPPEPKYMKPGCEGVDCKPPGDCVVIGTTVRCLGVQYSKEKLYWFSK